MVYSEELAIYTCSYICLSIPKFSSVRNYEVVTNEYVEAVEILIKSSLRNRNKRDS